MRPSDGQVAREGTALMGSATDVRTSFNDEQPELGEWMATRGRARAALYRTIRVLRRVGASSSRRSGRYFAAALLSSALVLALAQRTDFSFRPAPSWIPIVALVAILLGGRRLPLPLLGFWLHGVVTLFWSLAPGNTLVAFVWEAANIAAFLAGANPVAVGLVLGTVVFQGFLDVAALSMFQLQQYLSGSINYVAGAMGVAAIAPALWLISRAASSWLYRILGVFIGAIGLTLAIASGSRAVYLSLIACLALIVVKVLGPNTRAKANRYLLGVMLMACLVLVLDAASGFSIVSPAVSSRVASQAINGPITEYGVLRQRLRLWEQGLHTVLEYPLGTGAGSYRATTHAFQQFPMLWSSSPHNYAIEVLVTGGWLQLILLCWVVFVSLANGFNSARWPWAVSVVALGVTLLFDVTASYPRVTTVFFMLLGVSFFGRRQEPVGRQQCAVVVARRPTFGLVHLCCIVLASAVLWWYLPCNGPTCVTSRYLGLDEYAIPAVASSNEAEKGPLLAAIRKLYPNSLWVLQLDLAVSSDPAHRLALSREIATSYPLQHPNNFLRWAESALAAGDVAEARRAVLAGLAVFPPDTYPFGEARMTNELYQAWIDDANAILDRK